jgi:hypothetical protein
MGGPRSWIAGAYCVLALALAGAAVAAEGDQMLATVGMPAVVTAMLVAPERAGEPRRVIVSVTAFRPPQDGHVMAVVKAESNGTEQEIGRFGIFPEAEFSAAESSKTQRFGLRLPKELASAGPVKLNIYLVPSIGEGAGARLEVGGAEIR